MVKWTELLGFVTGAICVWLQVKENVWNWPAGIANNIFYVVVFWRSGLYADSLLQWFYISISIYGWCCRADRVTGNGRRFPSGIQYT